MMVAIPAFVLAAASDPGLVDACGPKGEQSWLCSTVYRITGDTHAADIADALSKPIRIVVVVLAASLRPGGVYVAMDSFSYVAEKH